MTEKDFAIANNKFYKFLQGKGPQKESDCALFQSKTGKYYLVVVKTIGFVDPMYLINDRYWFDFTKDFIGSEEWKLIYKRVM